MKTLSCKDKININIYFILNKILSQSFSFQNDRPLCGTYEVLFKQCPSFAKFFADDGSDKNNKHKLKKDIKVAFGSNPSNEVHKLDNAESITGKFIPIEVYKKFFRAAGNPFLIILTSLFFNFSYSVLITASDYWIKIWYAIVIMVW